MKSNEDPADSDYGSRVLTAFRKQGLPTSQWKYATIQFQAIERASRLEFLALFKKHDRLASYALIELIRTAAPEALVERLVAEEKARQEFTAIIPMMFLGVS